MSSKWEVGSRVCTGSGASVKHGVVAFVGETSFSTGEWIGIVLDAAEGKNDGSVAGVRYFSCEPNFGLFVKSAQCKPSQLQLPIAQASAPVTTPAPAPVTTPALAPVPGTDSASAPYHQSLAADITSSDVESGASSPTAEKETRDKLAALREKRRAREAAQSHGLSPTPVTREAAPATPTPVVEFSPSSSSAMSAVDANLSRKIADLELLLKTKTESLELVEGKCSEALAVLNKKVGSLEQQLAERTEQMEEQKRAQAAPSSRNTESDQSTPLLQKQIAELNDTIEMLTLDKEQLLVDNELAEENQSKLFAQIAQLKAESSDSKSVDTRALMEENVKLRDALKRLHDVASQDKEVAQTSTRQVELQSKELTELRKFKVSAASDLDELKKSLNESKSGELEAMIESLSERNHQLQIRAQQLEMTVQDLEAAQEMMEELDASQRAELERLRKSEDALSGFLREREQQVQSLEAKCADLRKVHEALVKTMLVTKEEGEVLKAKLQVHSSDLEESSSKNRNTSSLKLEIESLLGQLAVSRRKMADADLIALHSKVTADRMVKIFGDLPQWEKEAAFVAEELQTLDLAFSGSVVCQLHIEELRLAASLHPDDLIYSLALLDGVCLCWLNACSLLQFPSRVLRNTVPFREVFKHVNPSKESIIAQFSISSIRERCLDGQAEVDKLILLSFIMNSIEIIAGLIPKLPSFSPNSPILDHCRAIVLVIRGCDADALLGEYALNMDSLLRTVEYLLTLVRDDVGDQSRASSQAALDAIESIKRIPSRSTGLSVLDTSLLMSWSLGLAPQLVPCEWVSRVKSLSSTNAGQERDRISLIEISKAMEALSIDYEMKKEEARAASQRTQELRKLLESQGSGDTSNRKFIDEIKTLTEALEVLENRNEASEKEIKRLKARAPDPASTDFPSATLAVPADALDYWRRIATQRLSATMKALPRDALGEDYSVSIALSKYRSKRIERACFRVA